MSHFSVSQRSGSASASHGSPRQGSPYAPYTEQDKSDLEYIYATCGLNGPPDLHPPLFTETPTPDPLCLSGKTHTITTGETCDIIALREGTSSAALHSGNAAQISTCSALVPGRELCVPLGCKNNYEVQDGDTCYSIEAAHGLPLDTVRQYNTWVDPYCTNLHSVRDVQGSVICLSPQGGTHDSTGGGGGRDAANGGYSNHLTDPPAGSTVAAGTTQWCGRWHTVVEGDRCVTVMIQTGITAALLLEVNPSLSRAGCDGSLVRGRTYCVAPHLFWDDPDLESSMRESSVLTEKELEDLGFL
ncbi:hypothetical protein BJX68DRAFT_267134 [Aspergillus pseudodeflectus]|uniref:LysM domain-containing protein n=1 Tax=Aspergillus pseudodeflectus TaxID=176178 RepID=A0ABR4KDA5_9EURO